EVVKTEEYVTEEVCYREADQLLLLATFNHLQTLIGENHPLHEAPATEVDERGGVRSKELEWRIGYLSRLGITIDYIRRDIARDEYITTTERSFGPMKRISTLLEFSPEVDRNLYQRWATVERRSQMMHVGGAAGGVLSLLGLAFALLKVDTWTKGYYT